MIQPCCLLNSIVEKFGPWPKLDAALRFLRTASFGTVAYVTQYCPENAKMVKLCPELNR